MSHMDRSEQVNRPYSVVNIGSWPGAVRDKTQHVTSVTPLPCLISSALARLMIILI